MRALFFVFAFFVFTSHAQDSPQVITREDLRKTMEHIIALSKEQKAENEKLQSELAAAQASHRGGLEHGIELQKQVDLVTDDRNAQAHRADLAEDQVDKLKATIKELQGKIAKLKTMLAGEAAISALFLLLWLGIPKFSPPWGLVITLAAPAFVFGLAWKIL